MLERNVENYLIERVKAIGGEIRKVRWIGRHGAPDRLIMMPGVSGWVELKRPGEKPKPHQLREIQRMRNAGMRVWVAESILCVENLLETLISLSGGGSC